MTEVDWKRRAEAYRQLLIEARAKLVTCVGDTPEILVDPIRERVLGAMIEKITTAIEG